MYKVMIAKIATTNPIIFFCVDFSLKIIKPKIAERRTTETFVNASTVESDQPVVLYESNKK